MRDLTQQINKLKARILTDIDSASGEELYYRMLALEEALKVHAPPVPVTDDSLILLSPMDAEHGDGRIFYSECHRPSGGEVNFGGFWAFNTKNVHGNNAYYNWHNNPVMSGWLALRLDERPFIYRYAVSNTAVKTHGRMQDWVLEVSDDSTNGSNGSWVKVDEHTDSQWAWQSRMVFELPQPVRAKWVRLRVTKVDDPHINENWQIDLLEYWGKPVPAESNADPVQA